MYGGGEGDVTGCAAATAGSLTPTASLLGLDLPLKAGATLLPGCRSRPRERKETRCHCGLRRWGGGERVRAWDGPGLQVRHKATPVKRWHT